MQQVPGTYSMSWSEIQKLDLHTFEKLLDDKSKLIEQIAKARGRR